MKKTIIKNWIRYSASTLAISGMLVVGACGDSNERAENEMETAETEIEAPVREDVAEVEPEPEESEADFAAIENEEVKTTTSSSRSNDLGATFVRDMDAFLEEHKEVNQQITAALIESDNNLDAGSTPGSTME